MEKNRKVWMKGFKKVLEKFFFVHDEIYFVVNYSSRVDVVCVCVCMCMYVCVCMCMSPSFMDFHDGITFECIEIES